MKSPSTSGTPEASVCPQWGLKRNISPCFGARLVQEGNRLHYLADRADIAGTFSATEARQLDQAFPLIMKQLELMLTSGELNPRHQHCVTLYHNGLTCEADTLGSCGYVCIAIYPTSPADSAPGATHRGA
jgi:cytoskeleton bundling-enhancing protein CbeA-like protein